MKTIKIDVSLLDKTKFYRSKKAAKDGHFPVYCEIVLFENQYGRDEFGNDGFAKQSVSKEDRAAGVKMPILGNWKDLQPNQNSQPRAQDGRQQPEGTSGAQSRGIFNRQPQERLPLAGSDIPF